MDYLKRGSISVASIILHYSCGCFAWFIAYQALPPSDMKGLYLGAIAILSRDIVERLISKEWFAKVKDLLLQLVK